MMCGSFDSLSHWLYPFRLSWFIYFPEISYMGVHVRESSCTCATGRMHPKTISDLLIWILEFL